jgi:hypothetical protein
LALLITPSESALTPHKSIDSELIVNLFFGPGTDRPIRTAIDVLGYLHEDKKYQYRDGFSMAEAAKSWVAANGSLPLEIARVVGSDTLDRAHFEYPTRVWGGGTAMTDVTAFVPDGVIAVEAKVDETFDDLVSVWMKREAARNPRSPDHRRKVIQKYADSFKISEDALMNVRYQLLQRTLCAAIVARDAGVNNAWMIVHSFPSTRTGIKNTNRSDFDSFLALIGRSPILDGICIKFAWASASP